MTESTMFEGTFCPRDFSDVGQAEVLVEKCGHILRHSPATDYLVYTGSYWTESKERAQGLAQQLTRAQMKESQWRIDKAKRDMTETGANAIIKTMGNKAVSMLNKEQLKAYDDYREAVKYHEFAIGRRTSKNITATLSEVKPMVEIDPRELDTDVFLLNTPSATYDLRQGIGGKKDHTAGDFITKITNCDPDTENADIWEAALQRFFCNDTDLIDYVQRIVGLAAIGKVFLEALIIAHGDGRNGKSTFWNVISRVLGSYSGNVSADALTVNCRRNIRPELAEAKGKRLLIAAELGEGTRLNTSIVKQFCSTDEIFAEKKYKDPFSFKPSHMVVLYTNHLPKVSAMDNGTWRRLLVIPFNAKIEGTGDIKNYADYLYDKCSGAILTWIIEGARLVIADGFRLKEPDCVTAAREQYRENNNWLEQFIMEMCDVDGEYREKSGHVYSAYRSYCVSTGDYVRSTTDFYDALDTAGYIRRKHKDGSYVYGLKIKEVDCEF